MSNLTIGFMGLTHLAINTIAATAQRGFNVIGYDSDPKISDQLTNGILPFSEPDLYEYLTKNADRICFSSDAEDIKECDIIYVAPDVPTDGQGNSDLSIVNSMVELAGQSMRDDAILVILSQVPPGFTRSVRRSNERLFYQVETLIFGRAIERAMYPERLIIGCANPGDPLPHRLETLLKAFDCPILPMRYESAELCKISINMFLVASVTTSNVLAEICSAIGADWREIAPALRLDKRIGPYAYLDPGLGISGGNLERDLSTLRGLSNSKGTHSLMVRGCIEDSIYRKDWPLRMLHKVLPECEGPVRVAILGLSYKENTDSVKNSPSIRLIGAMPAVRARVYDPAVPISFELPNNFERSNTPDSALDGADILMIMTPWSVFRDLDLLDVKTRMRGSLVIDPYQMLDRTGCFQVGLNQIVLGS